MWRDNIPKIACKHQFVAQLLLALSALHIARSEESERVSHIAKSNALQSEAMGGMMAALSEEPDANRTSALFVAAMLLCFCSLAKGPSPGQYLVYSDEVVPPWMHLVHGVKSILTQQGSLISGITGDAEEAPSVLIEPDTLFPGYSKAITDLKEHISVLRAEDGSFDKYTQPVEDLRSSFETAFVHQDGRTNIKSQHILAWMYRLDEDFQKSLQERRPMALVILAHYAVVFARLDRSWYVEGWGKHIMQAVKRDLHPAYERWLQWPTSQL